MPCATIHLGGFFVTLAVLRLPLALRANLERYTQPLHIVLRLCSWYAIIKCNVAAIGRLQDAFWGLVALEEQDVFNNFTSPVSGVGVGPQKDHAPKAY